MIRNGSEIAALLVELEQRQVGRTSRERTIYQDWNLLQTYLLYRQSYDSLLTALVWEREVTEAIREHFTSRLKTCFDDNQVSKAHDFANKLYCKDYEFDGMSYTAGEAIRRSLDINKHRLQSLATQLLMLEPVEYLIVSKLLHAIAETWSIESGKEYVATYGRYTAPLSIEGITALLPEELSEDDHINEFQRAQSENDYMNAFQRVQIVSRFLWTRGTHSS